MSNQQRPMGHKKTVLDDPTFKLTCPPLSGQSKKPTLHHYYNINPENPNRSSTRIVLWLNNNNPDPKKSKIEARISPDVSLAIQSAIRHAAEVCMNTPPGEDPKVNPFVIQNKQPKDFKNPQGEKRNDSKIVIGADKVGVFISLLHWDTNIERLKFYFGFTEYHELMVPKDANPSSVSAHIARGIAETLQLYIALEHREHWRPWDPNSNNQNRNNNSGGHYDSSYPSNNSGGGSSQGADDDNFDGLLF